MRRVRSQFLQSACRLPFVVRGRGASDVALVASSVRGGGASFGRRVGLLVACVVSLGLVATPAAQAGKFVDRVIGSEEFGDMTGGAFFVPQDVAVNSTGVGGVAPGTLYVADGFNNRVQRFAPSGAFERAWGADVDLPAGGTDLEVCTVAANCKAGESSAGNGTPAGNGGLSAAYGVAVDGDSGNVYVVSANASQIDVYDADGAFLRAFGFDVVAGNAEVGYEVCVQADGDVCQAGVQGAGTGQLGGSYFGGPRLAVSPPDGNPSTGRLYLSQFSERVEVYDLDGSDPSNFGSGKFSFAYPRDIAVDDEIVYASTSTNQNQVERYDIDSDTFLAPIDVTALASDIDSSQSTVGLDIDPDSGNLLVARSNPTAGIVEIANPATAPAFADRHVADSDLRSVTVNPVSDELIAIALFVGGAGEVSQLLLFNEGPAVADMTISGTTDIGSGGATLNGAIDSSGSLPTEYKFQISRNGVDWITKLSGTVAAGDSETIVAPVSGLSPNTLYRVRLLATRTLGNPELSSPETTFVTDAVPPRIVSSGSDSVGTTSARLTGYVNPHSTPTSYRFEWGTESGNYVNRVPMPNALLGSGPSAALAAEEISGLEPATTYYFRLVAISSTAGTTFGPERTLTTRSVPLPARAAELVSPPVKSPGGLTQFYLPGVEPQFQVAEDGESVFYVFAYGTPDSTMGGELRYKGTRGGGGWSSVQMSPTLTQDSQPEGQGRWSGRYRFLSDDLSCGVLVSAEVLTPDASHEFVNRPGANLYRRDADASYELLAPEPLNLMDMPPINPSSEYGPAGGYPIRGATQDCRRAVFDTPFRFPGVNDSGLYVSVDGVVKDIAVRPDGSDFTASDRARVGSGDDTGTVWRAVSEDVSHVYFTATSNDGDDSGRRALYLYREGEQTVKVSASETATAAQAPLFQTAAIDGSKVSFLANYGLTDMSSTGPVTTGCTQPLITEEFRPCALYVYDVASGELTDVSATDDPANTNGATVAGVLAASDDMSRVYFAAQGQLVPGEGGSYADNLANRDYNIYLSQNGQLKYVAQIDRFDLSAAGSQALLAGGGLTGRLSTQATTSGEFLLFSSSLDVVGYDSGGEQEAYLFSAATGEIRCVSCRRDGEPSVGTAVDTGPVATSPVAISYSSLYLARPRMLSDDGRRVFFTKLDALAPGAENGDQNVYVWDEGVVRLLDRSPRNPYDGTYPDNVSELVGTTLTGDDVFISTSSALDPADTDEVKDIYDFRVGGGFAPPPTPPTPCDPLADGCQGGGAGTVSSDTATSLQSGDGNSDSGERTTLTVEGLSAKARKRAARSGTLALSVRTTSTDRVSVAVRAKLGKRASRVGGASKPVRKAGAVRVSVRLSSAARERLRSGKKLRLTVVITQRGARSLTRSVVLPGAGS